MRVRVLHTNAGKVWSGIEARILMIASYLHPQSACVGIACSPSSPLYKEAKKRDIPVFSWEINCRWDPYATLRLREIIGENQFHILHAHRSKDHWVDTLATRILPHPIKLIRTRHNLTPIPRNLFNHLLYHQWTDKIVAVAEVIREDLVFNFGLPPQKVNTIPSAVFTEKFFPQKGNLREELNIPSSFKLVGMIGRIRKHKDYPNFIQASYLLKKEFPFVKFVIVGEGPLEREIKHLVKEKNLEKDFYFLGERKDIPNVLASLDVFVLSSSIEGSPAVIKEALAMEKGVVATKVGGIPEIIEDRKEGLLVESGDSLSLKEAILYLLKHPQKAREMGKRGREKVLKKFSPEELAFSTLKIYQQVLTTKHSHFTTIK